MKRIPITTEVDGETGITGEGTAEIQECDVAWQYEETCTPETPCTSCWFAR
jgi:hypothetical protein